MINWFLFFGLLTNCLIGVRYIAKTCYHKSEYYQSQLRIKEDIIYKYYEYDALHLSEAEYQKLMKTIYGRQGNEMAIIHGKYKFELCNPQIQLLILQHKLQPATKPHKVIDYTPRGLLVKYMQSDPLYEKIPELRQFATTTNKSTLKAINQMQFIYNNQPLIFEQLKDIFLCFIITFKHDSIVHNRQDSNTKNVTQILDNILFQSSQIDPIRAQKDPNYLLLEMERISDNFNDPFWSAAMYHILVRMYSTGSKKHLQVISPLNAVINKNYCVYELKYNDAIRHYISKVRSVPMKPKSIFQDILDDVTYMEWLLKAYEFNFNFMYSKIMHYTHPDSISWLIILLQYIQNTNSGIYMYKKTDQGWVFVKQINRRNSNIIINKLKQLTANITP